MIHGQSNTQSYSIHAKWGEAANAGFSQFPDALLKHQQSLGLSSTELIVLLNINAAWWRADRAPFPTAAGISRRMGVSPRTVQRALETLESKGFLARSKRQGASGLRYEYDLGPLREALIPYAKRDPYYRKGEGDA